MATPRRSTRASAGGRGAGGARGGGAQRPRSQSSRDGTAPRPRPARGGGPGGRRPRRSGLGAPKVRHRLVLAMIMVAVLALSGRLLWVQGLNSQALAQEAYEQRSVTRPITALRGDITDRDGTVLASSVERYDLWVNQVQVASYKENWTSTDVKGVEAAAEDLAPVLGWTVEETTEVLTGDDPFKYLEKNVEPAVRNAVLSLDIPGIGGDRVADRIYPAGSVGGNVLGYVGADGTALGGAELTYDDVLAGTDGEMTYEQGAGGQVISTAPSTTTEAVDGSDLALTIDRDLQWKTQEVLQATIDQWGATGGAAVVYNPKTGEVLALADAPTFDPNDVGSASSEDLGIRSVSSVFDPGSTGKLFTMAAALEEGTAEVDSEYEVPYTMDFNGERIKDSHSHPDQQLTMAGILKNSSNTGTVQVAETMTPETRYDYLMAFGLGQTTDVGLPGESAGIVRPAEDWTGRTRYTTSFGQGYSVTALQMVSAIGAFANDGVRVQPQIVAGVREDDGSISPVEEPERTRAVSAETADEILAMMDNNIDDEESGARVEGYAVGGKSGTAEVPDGTYTSSFIGVAPADDPQLVVGVYLFGLNTFISGTRAAAPAFSDVMTFALQNQGIAPTGVLGRELENEW